MASTQKDTRDTSKQPSSATSPDPRGAAQGWDSVDESVLESFPASDAGGSWAGPDRDPNPTPRTAELSLLWRRTKGWLQRLWH